MQAPTVITEKLQNAIDRYKDREDIIFTELGIEQIKAKGANELLVSYRGLDKLLSAAPISAPLEPAVVEPVVDAPVADEKVADPVEFNVPGASGSQQADLKDITATFPQVEAVKVVEPAPAKPVAAKGKPGPKPKAAK